MRKQAEKTKGKLDGQNLQTRLNEIKHRRKKHTLMLWEDVLSYIAFAVGVSSNAL